MIPYCFLGKALLKHRNCFHSPMANCKMLFHVFGVFILLCLMKNVGATEFMVGGTNGWTLPNSPNAVIYNQWAERNRFQVGDTLRFVYNTDNDSVLQVTKDDYDKCKTSAPLHTFKDGNTTVTLYESGPHYYISGNTENCLQNEKMVVTVMAYRGSSNGAPLSRFSSYVGAFVGLLFFLVHVA